MKHSELKQLIKEELIKVLNENSSNKDVSSKKLKNLEPGKYKVEWTEDNRDSFGDTVYTLTQKDIDDNKETSISFWKQIARKNSANLFGSGDSIKSVTKK